MSTPSYLGKGQPLTSGGLLAKLSSYFAGSATPSYAAPGQLGAAQGNASVAATPSYAPAPVQGTEADTPNPTCACMQVQEAEATDCPIDADALAAGQIAIVIPRQGS